MTDKAWKRRERTIANALGSTRAPGAHGADFFIDMPSGVELRAEVKLRKGGRGTRMLETWLEDRDVLFTCGGNRPLHTTLVTMTLPTFLEHFDPGRGDAGGA